MLSLASRFRSASNTLSLRKFHSSLPFAGRKKVTLIPGDGVWPDLFLSVKAVFRELDVPVDFEELSLNAAAGIHSKELETAIESIRRNKACLKGIIRTPVDTVELNTVNMAMRRTLDLYANVVHIRTLPGITTRYNNLDFVIIREQLEGEYSSLEHESVKGVVESLKIITRRNSERIAKFAFDYAVRNNRKKVTAVHKANIMKLGDGLFLESCKNMANLYPHVEFNSMIVDNCCMQLVSKPQQFDVLVMPNLYGNIVDNLAAGLVGGAGVVPGVCFSHELALFEPGTRHSFSLASGRDIANPTAILLASSSLLRHINLSHHADHIQTAVLNTIRSGDKLTADIGGSSTTSEFTDAVLRQCQLLPAN